MLEEDFELVAFDDLDHSVAEFAVEDALAQRQVVAAFVAEGDGAGAGFDGGARPHPPVPEGGTGPSLSREGRGARGDAPHEAGASRAAAHRLRWAEVGEGVGVFAPLGAP